MKQPKNPSKSARPNAASPSKPLEPLNSFQTDQVSEAVKPSESTQTLASTLPQPPSKRRVSLRRLGVWAFRLAFLAATLGAFVGGSVELARAAAQTSPLVFLVALASDAAPFANGSTAAASGFTGGFLVGASIFSAVVFALTLFKRRFYCRFVCPLGTAVDAAAHLRRRLFPRRFRFLRTGFVVRSPGFALFFGTLTLGSLALAVLFGVSFAGRSALELDPTALLSRWTLDFPTFGVLGGVFLTAFVASPLFWRFHLCPCGALQDVCFFGLRPFFRRRTVAPRPGDNPGDNPGNTPGNTPGTNSESADPIAAVSNADAPKNALNAVKTGKTASLEPPARRRFLRTLALFGLAVATLTAVRRWSARILAATPFRPPGALPEEAFFSRCARCGRCVAACPTQLLRFDAPSTAVKTDAPAIVEPSENVEDANASDENDETAVKVDATAKTSPLSRPAPRLIFDGGAFCEKDCVACGTACPTGAISPLTLDAKKRFKIATVDFIIDRCLIYYQQECAICRRECPFEAIDFVWNEEEYASLPVVDAEKCVGCGRCVAFCPGEPIFVESVDEEIADDAPRPKALVLRSLDRPTDALSRRF
ncbi:MAG: 4Fe-4S binding protein [Thermoguttaceae bacterium]|nr:4Fe-4S binding protein [Thermoguttaceae bacterium]